MFDSLVLNAAGLPVTVVSWQRAVSLYFAEKAIVLAEYDNKPLRSPNFTMRAPAVIQCTHSLYRPKRFVRELPFSRRNVYMRDNGMCMYCGKRVSLSSFTFDHVIPRSRGGRTSWDNIVAACSPCNLRKGGRMAMDIGMQPHHRPHRPTTFQLQEMGRRFPPNHLHDTWLDYLYWDVELEQ